MTVYNLRNADDPLEIRHLESRMDTVWQVAGWSSAYPPSEDDLGSLREMIKREPSERKHSLTFCEESPRPGTRGWDPGCSCGGGIWLLLGKRHDQRHRRR